MSEEPKIEINETARPVITPSRRDVLKILGTGLAAALTLKEGIDLTGNLWQPEVVHLGIDTVKNPETVENSLKTSAKLLEGLALRDHRAKDAPPINENPFYRPVTEIIDDVLESRKRSGKPIKFQRIQGYKDADYYLERVQKSIDDPKYRDTGFIKTGELDAKSYILGYVPGAFTNAFHDSEHPIFPPEAVPFWEAGDKTFSVSRNMLIPGSGIANYVVGALGSESKAMFDSSSDYWMYNKDKINQLTSNYLQDIKTKIETEVAAAGRPVSAGIIFDYSLDKNGGDVVSSLMDTMIFLKYMARQDTTFQTLDGVSDDADRSNVNEEWFDTNILDEYGKIGNYHGLPHNTFTYYGLLSISPDLANPAVDKDLHKLNQIGKPYHTWTIALMLSAIPPTVIQAGVLWRQFNTFNEQGPVKTAADFETALKLSKLQEILLKYS